MACRVKVNRHAFLAFRLFWNRIRSWEGTGLKDTPEHRKLVEAQAILISQEIEHGTFDYLKWFPHGNKAHLFRPQVEKPPALQTIESYYKTWIEKQRSRVRPHQIKHYQSHFTLHILPTMIGSAPFGRLLLSSLRHEHLKKLQDKLREKDLKASSVNAVVHSSLRALLRDARGESLMTVNLYDRVFFKPLPLTDVRGSIDPYTPEERELILEGFRTRRPQYFAFVYFQFWTGARVSETTALRYENLDLRYATARIQRSRVQGHEAGTKTERSNRELHLHANLVQVLKDHKPLHVEPDDYVFTTPQGAPISEDNFYHREWLPMLQKLSIRPRPFYNTRHSYISFLLSIGAKPAFVSSQTGDSIRTLENHYAKYIPGADSGREALEASIRESATLVQPRTKAEHSGKTFMPVKIKKPMEHQRLRREAGDRGRTGDLVLGKHTL
jgi:integrase